ncbi:AMP-binding protein [Haloferula chungangensis]|uniref:AMP-binding protein n=1 Tax=Haloferula chungangensis TaxID=1048331 RepID=A0ABW2L3V4_9BACT
MLLLRWNKTLEKFRDQPAIFDGERVSSFSDLAESLAALPAATGPIAAQGSAHQIALATLQGWRDGQAILPLEKPGLPELGPIPEGVAHLKLTPGNEGQPRTVRFTAAQIAADADRLVAAMDLTPEIPNLATISLSHSYGYSSIILPLLLHGIPIQTVEVPFPAVVTAAWKNHKRVIVPAVPSMWRAWHRSGILKDAPIALAISAGAPLSLELETAIWNDCGLKLHNFYGASECGGISYDRSSSPRSHPDDLGEALPGVDVTLDASGRFMIRSSSVALGYDDSRSDEKLTAGSFLTPDHGHLDGPRLLLDSRGGDTINVAGRKLGPGRIEAVLRATGFIEDVRVFGIPSHDPERVDEVAALITTDHSIRDLSKAVADTLAGWEIPRHWITDPEPGDWQLTRQSLRKKHAGLAK